MDEEGTGTGLSMSKVVIGAVFALVLFGVSVFAVSDDSDIYLRESCKEAGEASKKGNNKTGTFMVNMYLGAATIIGALLLITLFVTAFATGAIFHNVVPFIIMLIVGLIAISYGIMYIVSRKKAKDLLDKEKGDKSSSSVGIRRSVIGGLMIGWSFLFITIMAVLTYRTRNGDESDELHGGLYFGENYPRNKKDKLSKK